MKEVRRKSPLGILLIGVFKLISAFLLILLGVGIFREIGSDPALEAEHLIALLKLDPKNHYIHSVMSAVSGVSTRQLYFYSAGTFVYALLYAIEGIGLVFQKRWGEYFTIGMTGSLIPLEFYEVIRRQTFMPCVILLLNVSIVAYLVVQLRRAHALERADKAVEMAEL